MKKVIVGLSQPGTTEKAEAMRAAVAAHLGLCCEDVLVLHGVAVTIVDVPESALRPAPVGEGEPWLKS